MENGDDEVFEPTFDPAKFRTHVAAFVKSLIRARWKHEPGFLTPAQLERWELKSIERDEQSAWRNMEHAAQRLAVLARNFIPFGPSGGLPLMRGATPVEILIEEVGFLVPGCGGDPNHNQELLDATTQLRSDHRIDWSALVEWNRLDAIRDQLDKLPMAKNNKAKGDGATSRFFWDGGNWQTQYEGGRPNTFPDLHGFFYIWVLLCDPLRRTTATRILAEKVRFEAAQHIRRRSTKAQAGGDQCCSSEANEPVDIFDFQNAENWESPRSLCEMNSKQDIANTLAVLRQEKTNAEREGASARVIELASYVLELEQELNNSTWQGHERTEAELEAKNERDKVRKAVSRALDRIKEKDAGLGNFLDGAIVIGPLCYCRFESVCNWSLSKKS